MLFLDHIGPRIGLISASVAGRKAYSQRIWLLRTHSRLIFSRCEVGHIFILLFDLLIVV